MRTFEFKKGKTTKFWNIEQQGSTYIVTSGRIGTKGRTQTKEFKTAPLAKAAHDKLIAGKLANGYVETTAGKPAGLSPLQQSLEQALVENPDDLAAHSAYADYLSEQGDPRGEFIQVQLGLEDSKRSSSERRQLQMREKSLLREHGLRWLGSLAPFVTGESEVDPWKEPTAPLGQLRFARGWLDSLEIARLTDALATELAQAGEVRLLRRLTIDSLGSGTAATILAACPHLSNVRALKVGQQAAGLWSSDYSGMELIQNLPRMEELVLSCLGGDAFRGRPIFSLPTLHNLRVLEVHVETTEYTDLALEILAANPALHGLTQLRLCGGRVPYPLPPDSLRALLDSSCLNALTHLALRSFDVRDAGCALIAQSDLLRRLRVLDLTDGRITDRGARTLAMSPDLGRLEELHLSGNPLTDVALSAVRQTGVRVIFDVQRLQLTDRDFDHIHDDETTEGDME
jgi:uncharacterized protein (TIGR02996 family)